MINLERLTALGSPLVLLALNLAFAAVAFQFVDPAREEALSDSERLVRQTGSLRRQIQKMVRDRKLLPQRQAEYEKLVEKRFVGLQDRLRAIRVLEDLRKKHRLTGIKYQFSPEREVQDSAAEANGFMIATTRVSVLLRSHLDSDLIGFTRDLPKRFPGQVRVESLLIKREKKPTRKLLIDIRNGKNIDLVSGSVVFDWRTLGPSKKKERGKSGRNSRRRR